MQILQDDPKINQWNLIEIGHRLNLDRIKRWIRGALLGGITPLLDIYTTDWRSYPSSLNNTLTINTASSSYVSYCET